MIYEEAETSTSTEAPRLVWLWLLFVGLAIAVMTIAYQGWQRSQDRKQAMMTLMHVINLKENALALPLYLDAAIDGDKTAYDALTQARNEFNQSFLSLETGDAIRNQEKSPFEKEVEALSIPWLILKQDAETILANQNAILDLKSNQELMLNMMPAIHKNTELIIKHMVSSTISVNELNISLDLASGAIEVEKFINLITRQQSAILIEEMQKGLNTLISQLLLLQNGSKPQNVQKITDVQARRAIEANLSAFQELKDKATQLSKHSFVYSQVAQAKKDLELQRFPLIQNTTALYEQHWAHLKNSEQNILLTMGLLASILLVGLAMLALFHMVISKLTRNANRKNDAQQQSILRLVGELGHFAHGDLRVKATITSDLTAPIAETFNFAIGALRKLVSTINNLILNVSKAAHASETTALKMVKAINVQAKEILQATAAVTEMAKAIEGVAHKADVSQKVALESVATASQGTEAVKNTMVGMDSIRAQILETSKRMKRLGESSQEIGDIVELIRDLAKRTNLLALNASIQAALAGEHGQGFALVADEVQQLAENSHKATQKIEILVNAIQHDTAEVVHSMEESTANVVQGATLAQHAQTALDKIEQVSQQMAGLIQEISGEAQTQAVRASKVATAMVSIETVSKSSAQGVSVTAQEIAALATHAKELQRSVSGFKLPNTSSESP